MKMTAREMPRSYWQKVAERNGIRYGTYHRRVTEYGWTPNEVKEEVRMTLINRYPLASCAVLLSVLIAEVVAAHWYLGGAV